MTNGMTAKTFTASAWAIALCAAAAAAYLKWLPDVSGLRVNNPRTTKYVDLYVRRSSSRGGKPAVEMKWVPLEEISPYLRCAVLIAEDDRFYSHRGVDWEALRQAAAYNLKRRKLARGASTITQQVARNLFLSPQKSPSQKLLRKLREILIARHLDRSLEKDRILEIYLNIVEWGVGIFGAEAASQAYFEKRALDLSPEEAVALVAALPSPYRLNPGQVPDPVTMRKIDVYLQRMRRAGRLPPPEE
ncbi:MAG: monofunctional biosynthetic peptidoglycan transglycosylase [Elusimicrobia bacterium]|nr:monofunctional biosynthetic peptidoglycan transglycosylase [Elusimicrobiota bacterium]